ncbi:MAG: 50S ribosomal protein L35 [bacterium]|nr:50S ribosomal protein L35 [bacterium]
MAKTNKSFLKRLRITRQGKILARTPGKNHFNARSSGAKQLRQKGLQNFDISKKALKRFLPFAKV